LDDAGAKERAPLKLIIAIINDRDKQKLSDVFIREGIAFTKIGSTGGFLRQGSVTLLIGVDDDKVSSVLEHIKYTCKVAEKFVNFPAEGGAMAASLLTGLPHPINVRTGGAVAFVVQVEWFEKL
jgi:uncharacterized protein YaaQ